MRSRDGAAKPPRLYQNRRPSGGGTKRTARAQKIFFGVWGKRKFFAPSSKLILSFLIFYTLKQDAKKLFCKLKIVR